MKQINIGLIGFGCVGQGLYEVFQHSLRNIGIIHRICVKNKEKPRSLPLNYFTFNVNDILTDPKIDTVVEAIDDAEEAYRIAQRALHEGKNLVTANKQMLALHLKELHDLALRKGKSLLYEASACGSIPIIRLLEEYYDTEPLRYIGGVFNGTTNYILTRTCLEGLDYSEALNEAQRYGFAESDPTSDVDGWDPTYKLVILVLHAFGIYLNPHEVPRLGITTLRQVDRTFAEKNRYRLRLLAGCCSEIENTYYYFVLPVLVSSKSLLYEMNYEYNGIFVEGQFTSQQFLRGKGAGAHPTGSALLSDLSALVYDYRYELKKRTTNLWSSHREKMLRVYLRWHRANPWAELCPVRWEEKQGNATEEWGIGWVRYEHLGQLSQQARQQEGFLALVEEPWHQPAPPSP
mgnify:CR=1 FL=1